MFMQSINEAYHKKTMAIFSIPETFVHIDTSNLQKVTPEMEEFLKLHLDYDNLVNALLTTIFHYVHNENKAIGIEGLEKKVEEVLQLLRETDVQPKKSNSAPVTQLSLIDQLDELLNEFGD